ncbi:MAG: PASTA domain-containing protein, partial [Gaiellaceae bacterium]
AETGAATGVPKLVGLTEPRARAALRERGYGVVVERQASVRPKGRVIAQQPEPGAELERGGRVALAVSSGKAPTPELVEIVEVPGVLNIGFVDAANVLEQLGLVADTFPVVSREPRGAVVSQNPGAGAKLAKGKTVRLNVALGTGSRGAVSIPDLTGPDERAARDQARQAGFTVRTLRRDAPSRDEVGEVIFQEPEPGRRVPVLTQITIYVGR